LSTPGSTLPEVQAVTDIKAVAVQATMLREILVKSLLVASEAFHIMRTDPLRAANG